MAEKNQYFPHLFEPLKVGSKTIKNRIEAAPALFAFEHYIELDPDRLAIPHRFRSVRSVCWRQRQKEAQELYVWVS